MQYVIHVDESSKQGEMRLLLQNETLKIVQAQDVVMLVVEDKGKEMASNIPETKKRNNLVGFTSPSFDMVAHRVEPSSPVNQTSTKVLCLDDGNVMPQSIDGNVFAFESPDVIVGVQDNIAISYMCFESFV